MATELTRLTIQATRRFEITDPKEIQFLHYIILPKAFRPHREYICGKLGIDQNTYYSWLRQPRFNEARNELVKQYYKDDIPDILMALKNEALAGNERAARLFLEYVDDFNKEQEKYKPFERPEALPIQEINIIINNLEQKFYGDQSKPSGQPVIEAGSEV